VELLLYVTSAFKREVLLLGKLMNRLGITIKVDLSRGGIRGIIIPAAFRFRLMTQDHRIQKIKGILAHF
jgi:hypothetical protein